MAFQTHEDWLVSFPFSDLSANKTRPAVVVSSDVYHRHEPDIMFAALTSNLAAAMNPTDYVLQEKCQLLSNHFLQHSRQHVLHFVSGD